MIGGMYMGIYTKHSRPTLFETRAAIGTAETPAEPINGLTLFFQEDLSLFLATLIHLLKRVFYKSTTYAEVKYADGVPKTIVSFSL